MIFKTYGDKNNPAILFFHAMGVVGTSSEPVIGPIIHFSSSSY